MKKLLSIVFLLFICCFYAQAQTDYKELVLGIPECKQTYNEWNKVKAKLQNMHGVRIKGICSIHDCILLEVDRNIHTNNQAIFDKIKEADSRYTIFEKQATFGEMMQMCQEELVKQK
jgi:hypothetical protein